jgi:hypothetical protein
MDFLNILNRYKRPLPERKLDQFYATPETVLKRVNLLEKFSHLKSIIFLGDDDLTSIALALNERFEKIMVIDIDDSILNLIKEISLEENLNIETLKWNVLDPLPKEIKNFNLAFFDPPYTPDALYVWLIRGLEIILGKGSNKKRKDINFLKDKFIFLCYGYTDKSLERGLKVQKIITDLGLIIQEKIRDFNQYTGAETIDNKSDFYILKPTSLIDLAKIDSLRSKKFEDLRIYTWE